MIQEQSHKDSFYFQDNISIIFYCKNESKKKLIIITAYNCFFFNSIVSI